MTTTKYQPGLRVSEYLLEQFIGRGTFGEVWRARHHVWESEQVAIKLPTEPEYVRFLQREGLVVHGLRHPNIVRVLGLDPYAEVPYLVMELVRGPSLRQIIDEHPKGCNLAVATTILRGILTGIAAAHEANVIHRDLKPGNVLLDLNGKPVDEVEITDVKLGDFGLGVPNEDALRSMVMQSVSIERDHRSSTIAGTLVYMAPELRDAEARPGPQTDLYSIGVILFELLTGERPVGTDLPGTLRADVPTWADMLFRRLYARAERRFQTAREVLALIEREVSAAPRDVQAAPDQLPPRRSADVSGASPGRSACPMCHAAVEPEDQFCTQCGGQLVDAVRRCTQCGGWPGPFDRYCIHCGAAVTAARG